MKDLKNKLDKFRITVFASGEISHESKLLLDEIQVIMKGMEDKKAVYALWTNTFTGNYTLNEGVEL